MDIRKLIQISAFLAAVLSLVVAVGYGWYARNGSLHYSHVAIPTSMKLANERYEPNHPDGGSAIFPRWHYEYAVKSDAPITHVKQELEAALTRAGFSRLTAGSKAPTDDKTLFYESRFIGIRIVFEEKTVKTEVMLADDI